VTNTDKPVCGYGLADGSMCLDDRVTNRCLTHEGLVCRGCRAHEATHACRHDDGAHLCEACGHITASQHGPAVDSLSVAEGEMDRVIELVLERLNATEVLPSTQVQRSDAASAIRRGMTMQLSLGLLAGMARHEGETP
jgi:hypothetical protein